MDNELTSEADSNTALKNYLNENLTKRIDELTKNIKKKNKFLSSSQRHYQTLEHVNIIF